jgi:hypothetical protein
MIRCKMCGESRALIAGLCLRCDKICGDVEADMAADLRDSVEWTGE